MNKCPGAPDRKQMVRTIACICLLMIFGTPASASGEQPLEVLKRNIDEAIRVLEDPQYRDDLLKPKQQEELYRIGRRLFDYREFSRRVLASHWNKFTPLQRNAFVEAFSEFLGKFYLRKIQERYRNERIVYVSQTMIDPTRAIVEINVLWKDLEVPVTIRMARRSGRWKAYDLSVLGINAVENYRAQFQSILMQQSPAQVIEMLREKVRKLDGDV